MQKKAQFELDFYVLAKDYLDHFRSREPVLTWVNDDKKPVISFSFLLFVNHETRVRLAMLLGQYGRPLPAGDGQA